jgi:hypothetical protein
MAARRRGAVSASWDCGDLRRISREPEVRWKRAGSAVDGRRRSDRPRHEPGGSRRKVSRRSTSRRPRGERRPKPSDRHRHGYTARPRHDRRELEHSRPSSVSRARNGDDRGRATSHRIRRFRPPPGTSRGTGTVANRNPPLPFPAGRESPRRGRKLVSDCLESPFVPDLSDLVSAGSPEGNRSAHRRRPKKFAATSLVRQPDSPSEISRTFSVEIPTGVSIEYHQDG